MEDRRQADVEFKSTVISELKHIKQELSTTKELAQQNTKKLNEWTVWIRAVRYFSGLVAVVLTLQWEKIVKYLAG